MRYTTYQFEIKMYLDVVEDVDLLMKLFVLTETVHLLYERFGDRVGMLFRGN